ncbi:MAG TPA: DUF6788 family protein [Candidatus Dormibacteraeota bacterium]|nr:DUF6788 family protein [Candidatus Dormibacteraeota bacterium]
MPLANKTDLSQLTARQLRARRRRLAAGLADPAVTLQGSLVNQTRRCGKEGCRCARGELHGPYVYLSVGRGKGARLLYVPAQLAEAARRHITLTGQIEVTLAAISAINLELLARRELD